MKYIHKIVAISIVAIVAFIAWTPTLTPAAHVPEIMVAEKVEAQEVEKPKLSHQQEVWKYALEWCESRGIKTAINPADSDGTASYYSWQFKPGTFKGYGEQYGLIEKGKTWAEIMELMKDYSLMSAIVDEMILDPKVKLETQFPGCVRQLGLPPRGTIGVQ